MNTEEGNKLICCFLYPENAEELSHFASWWFEDKQYHFSWDWLMPVVERISTIRYPDWGECEPYSDYAYPRTFGMLNNEGKPMVRINANTLHTADTLIEATWMAVVDFIIWYNTLQPKT